MGESLYLTDANGKLYLAEEAGVWRDVEGSVVFWTEARPDDAIPLYRLTIPASTGETEAVTPDPTLTDEAVEFRGARWFVADARWDDSGLVDGSGSHWHLTLTGPMPSPSRREWRARVGRSRGRKGEPGWRQR